MFGEEAPRVRVRERVTFNVLFPRGVKYPHVVWGLIFGHAVEIVLKHPHISKPDENQQVDIMFERVSFFTFSVKASMDFFNESHPVFEESYPYQALVRMFAEVGGRMGCDVEPVESTT
ncbi:MAG: hypothetical protein JWM52_202 [Candidatus Saccharibacteria bacterium]|nr:hypothetical protein [Candidatus Saccharibacteria bacterium]